MRVVSTDFDEFSSALVGADCRYLLKSRSTQPWQLDLQVFDQITCVVARNGGSAIYQGALNDAFGLLIGLSHTGSCVVNGDRLGEQDIVWVPPGHEFHAPSAGDVHWLSIMVARTEVEHWVASQAIRLDPRFLGYCSGQAAPLAVSRAAALVTRAIQFAEALQLHHRGSALHGQLTDAVLAILQGLQPIPQLREGRPRVNGKRILIEVVHLMEDRLDGTSHISDYSAAVGVSATTLRKVFREMLGTSPQRYLQTRRLHAIRSALMQAGPQDTVSSICSQYGVWDFGRFSGQFRQMFGVLPSNMLKGHRQLNRPLSRRRRFSEVRD